MITISAEALGLRAVPTILITELQREPSEHAHGVLPAPPTHTHIQEGGQDRGSNLASEGQLTEPRMANSPSALPWLPHNGAGWLAEQSAPSFLAHFQLTELTETRNLKLFTWKIKTTRTGLAYLYTEVSEADPAGKAGPAACTQAGSVASLSLSHFPVDPRRAAFRTTAAGQR